MLFWWQGSRNRAHEFVPMFQNSNASRAIRYRNQQTRKAPPNDALNDGNSDCNK
ncbi:hypothetical protein L195_g037606, partial [Trifolium pratense]